MKKFSKRSTDKELLDHPDLPFDAIRQNMKELKVINKYLGGHKITLNAIKNLIGDKDHNPMHIVEIGSGGGDNLKVIYDWAVLNNKPVNLTGVDLNAECIHYARNIPGQDKLNFVHSDYKNVKFETKPDILFSSLFCHHFSDDELIYQLQWMQENSAIGFFINDIHRHPLAYYSIKILTKLFSKSYLVKHDAPLSVLRAFEIKDLQQLMQKAGIYNYKLVWKWAFRWLLVYRHDKNNK